MYESDGSGEAVLNQESAIVHHDRLPPAPAINEKERGRRTSGAERKRFLPTAEQADRKRSLPADRKQSLPATGRAEQCEENMSRIELCINNCPLSTRPCFPRLSTVPDQCPISARSVPIQCPLTVPVLESPRNLITACHIHKNVCTHTLLLSYAPHFSKSSLVTEWALHRALNGHCIGH